MKGWDLRYTEERSLSKAIKLERRKIARANGGDLKDFSSAHVPKKFSEKFTETERLHICVCVCVPDYIYYTRPTIRSKYGMVCAIVYMSPLEKFSSIIFFFRTLAVIYTRFSLSGHVAFVCPTVVSGSSIWRSSTLLFLN